MQTHNKVSEIKNLNRKEQQEQFKSISTKMQLINSLQHQNKTIRYTEYTNHKTITGIFIESESDELFCLHNTQSTFGQSQCQRHNLQHAILSKIYENRNIINQIAEKTCTLEQIIISHEQRILHIFEQLKQFKIDIQMQQIHFDHFAMTLQHETSFNMLSVQELFQQMQGQALEMRPTLENIFIKIQQEQLQQCIENSIVDLYKMKSRVERVESAMKQAECWIEKMVKDFAMLRERQ